MKERVRNGIAATAVAALIASSCLQSAAWSAEPPSTKPENWSDAKTDCKALGLAKDPPWTIGVSNFSMANSWRVQMIAELEAAAKKDSRIEELIVTNSDGNLAKQLSDVEDLLTKGVDGLLITPLSPDGTAPVVEDAVDDGVAVVVFNDRVNTDKFHSIVWADEFKFGWIGGNWLKEKLGDKGNIVLLEGIAGTAVNDLRTNGALAGLGSNIKVLARQPASWAYDKGKAAMEDFISAYPEIDGVYSQGGAMSKGAIDALIAAKKPLIPVTGEGYNGFLKLWAENVDKGFSSVGPDEPTWQSVKALEQLTKCLSGEAIDKWAEIELPVITDATIKDYALEKCPDDVWSNTKMTYEEIDALYKCNK